MCVLNPIPNVPVGTHMKVYLDSELARGPKNVKSGRSQEFTIQLPPALFVVKISCTSACVVGSIL